MELRKDTEKFEFHMFLINSYIRNKIHDHTTFF